MRWIVWLLVAACSSGAGGAGGAAHPGPPAAAPPAAPPADDAPSEPECDQLITHAVGLGIQDQAGRAAGPGATESDHEAIRRSLQGEFGAGCRALSRDTYRCAMAATTLAQLAACQRTPSSSTSNSSVAPAGISPPPAPRSP